MVIDSKLEPLLGTLPTEEEAPIWKRNSFRTLLIAFGAFFMLLLIGIASSVSGWKSIAFGMIVITNVITGVLIYVDKKRAENDSWRIPEVTLLGWFWISGFLAGWASMFYFRHKTQKQSFLIKAGLVSCFNLLWYLIFVMIRF